MYSNEFLIDTNEPLDKLMPIMAPVVPIVPYHLNTDGYADYRWLKLNGKYKMVERKTWPELLSNTDKCEEQLLRHLTKHKDIELVFMLEGMVQNNELGSSILHKTSSGLFVKGHNYSARLKGIYSWLYEISNYCQVIQTTSLNESATCLVAMYEHDQKESHSTFKRNIKQVTFTTDPRVTMLMGAVSGLGDKRASSLVQFAGTPWNIFSAGFKGEPAISNYHDLTQVDGIGIGIVTNMLRNLGRPDV